MKRKLVSSAILAAAIAVGSLFNAGTASADANPAVCDGIAQSNSYVEYLLDSFMWGKALGYSSDQQARNIADSVVVYCPWHSQGIANAAAFLSGNSNNYVA